MTVCSYKTSGAQCRVMVVTWTTYEDVHANLARYNSPVVANITSIM